MEKKIEPSSNQTETLESFKGVVEAACTSANSFGEPPAAVVRLVVGTFASLDGSARVSAMAWLSSEMVDAIAKVESVSRARCLLDLNKAVNELRRAVTAASEPKEDGTDQATLFQSIRRARQLAALIDNATNDLSVKPGDTDEAWSRFSALVSDLVDVRNGMRDVHNTQGGAPDGSSVS